MNPVCHQLKSAFARKFYLICPFFGILMFALESVAHAAVVQTMPLKVSSAKGVGLELLHGSDLGIQFTNRLSFDHSSTNQMLLNGSGVALGDVDGDGWCDIYFCGLDGLNALYKNLGDWKFRDITAEAGVECPNVYATGALFADLDGDGDLDLLVNTLGSGTLVFINDGKGHFKDETLRWNLNPGKGGMSSAMADFDGDGFLDLYITNYRVQALMDMPNTQFKVLRHDSNLVVTMVNGRSVKGTDLEGRFEVRADGTHQGKW